MDLDKRNFHLPKSMIPASGNERIPPEKSGDFPAAILLPRSVDFRCSPAGTGPYFSIWVELDGLSSKMSQLKKEENEKKRTLENISDKEEKASPSKRIKLSEEKKMASIDFVIHSLKCESAAGKRDLEQKKHRREESQHNEMGFEVYRLKPELFRAINDCGFEHPSEVQHKSIPQAIRSIDIVCEAKSGMGKTASFVLATLQQLQPVDGQVSVIVFCHTRELAMRISREYERFSKYMANVKVSVFSGGLCIKNEEDVLKKNCPHIVVGTPGRILALVQNKLLHLRHVKHFIIDECDEVLKSLDMGRDLEEIFKMTSFDKQVLMFSAALSKEIRSVCKKFMEDPMEIYIDNETKLTLYGLHQHYVKSNENKKAGKLIDLLEKLEFNQVVIFFKSVLRCTALCSLLTERNFPAVEIHREMPKEQCLARYKQSKEFQTRILVTTNSFERGIDIERVNIVFNYDIPEDTDAYFHRVARAGRSITKGLAITYVIDESDVAILNDVQKRFDVQITEMPDMIDAATYIKNR